VDMFKSQRHTHSGAGRRVSQANEAAIYPKLTGLCQHEIVSGILEKWKQCGDCASQLWVPGRSCGHGRPYLDFCPIILQHFSFRCLFEKGADWYPFCPGGGTGRGVLGGEGGVKGVHPINRA